MAIDGYVRMFPVSQCAPSSGHQVEDQDQQRHNQQQVDQATGDMKAETQKPQNHQHYENCPKHMRLPSAS